MRLHIKPNPKYISKQMPNTKLRVLHKAVKKPNSEYISTGKPTFTPSHLRKVTRSVTLVDTKTGLNSSRLKNRKTECKGFRKFLEIPPPNEMFLLSAQELESDDTNSTYFIQEA